MMQTGYLICKNKTGSTSVVNGEPVHQMMSSEYIVIRIMCHNIFNIAIQNIAEFINRIDFYILIMP